MRAASGAAHPGQPLLVTGDERKGRRKRHLKARVDHRLGREQKDTESCHRDGAEGERLTIDHHPNQDNRDHDE
jgi:hypothetical protein